MQNNLVTPPTLKSNIVLNVSSINSHKHKQTIKQTTNKHDKYSKVNKKQTEQSLRTQIWFWRQMILLSFHSFDLELVQNSEREFLGFKSNSFCWVDLIVQSAFFSACFFCTAGRHEVKVLVCFFLQSFQVPTSCFLSPCLQLMMNWQIVSTCFEVSFSLPLSVPKADVVDEEEA